MSRRALLTGIGCLVAVLPFSGLPHTITTWLLLALGLVIAVLGYTLRSAKPSTTAPDHAI